VVDEADDGLRSVMALITETAERHIPRSVVSQSRLGPATFLFGSIAYGTAGRSARRSAPISLWPLSMAETPSIRVVVD